jgi:hypothetical protein
MLGTFADYAARAAVNRPTDPAQLAREIVRLHREHRLSATDIARALRVHYGVVVAALMAAP